MLKTFQGNVSNMFQQVPSWLLVEMLELHEAINSSRTGQDVGGQLKHAHSPRKVVEMYSDTWFPERLISDR